MEAFGTGAGDALAAVAEQAGPLLRRATCHGDDSQRRRKLWRLAGSEYAGELEAPLAEAGDRCDQRRGPNLQTQRNEPQLAWNATSAEAEVIRAICGGGEKPVVFPSSFATKSPDPNEVRRPGVPEAARLSHCDGDRCPGDSLAVPVYTAGAIDPGFQNGAARQPHGREEREWRGKVMVSRLALC